MEEEEEKTYYVSLTFRTQVDADSAQSALEIACDECRASHELVDWEVKERPIFRVKLGKV